MDLKSLHAPWQEKWEKAKLFEPEPRPATGAAAGPADGKFFLTAAFPYPNSPQHIGHARTYTTTDIYARFMRMSGRNVLFPMAFHVTGTPILAMAKRIGARDAELFGIFEKIYGIPPAVTSTLTEPTALVTYFSKEIEQGMKEMGYSIDWRRKFYTFDKPFNHFIQWQFRQLHAAGLIERGMHPVPWCPRDNQAVGGHDTRGDIDPELEEVTAVLFAAGEGFIPTITYRPETLPGVTNLWINPSANYVLCEQKTEKKKTAARAKPGAETQAPWSADLRKLYLSSDAFESLTHQLNLSKMRDVPASELLKLTAQHPLDGRALPLLPASFVKSEVGTGLVMSVPAHAPLDFLALRDGGWLEGGSKAAALRIQPIQVLVTPGYGSCPAGELVQKLGIASQTDAKAEEATKLLYKLEAHEGKILSGAYAKLTGAQAKEKVTTDLQAGGKALLLHVLANAPVFCRCGAACTVRIVDNQWFINYGDEKWKARARECLASMAILPSGLRREFEYTIGWLKQKACTRAAGLGTRFPFDEQQMIEALSDSTLYMAYYTIAPVTGKMKPEELTDEFFDYALLGRGKSKDARWEEARKQFLYWYPLDSRHSAHDLIRNHLTFFIFIHTAIFSQPQPGLDGKPRPASSFWPRQTVSNGFVTMDGKKMSKSMGNILPLRKAIAQFGPDVVRFVVTSTAELEADSDFNQPAAEGVISRLQFLDEQLQKTLASEKARGRAAPASASSRDTAGQWFYSRFHRRLQAAPGQYAQFELRPLSQAILYDTINDLQAYVKQSPSPDLREFFELWTLLTAPFMPHVAEEFWARLGPKKYVPASPFASSSAFPKADEKQMNSKLERAQEYLLGVREDIAHILKLLKKERTVSITLIVHASWKEEVRELVAQHKQMPAVMAAAKGRLELSSRMPQVSALAAKFMKNIGAITGSSLNEAEELSALREPSSLQLLEAEFKAPITILSESQAPIELAAKSANALPGKPAIVIA